MTWSISAARSVRTIGVLMSGSLVLLAGSAARAQPFTFVECSNEVGLDALHAPNDFARIPFLTAGGAVGDFNNDGWSDLFVLGSSEQPDKLFINQGVDGFGEISFVDQAEAWGVAEAHHSFGVSAADFNGDGYLDLFVTSFGLGAYPSTAARHKLYKNNGPDDHGQWSFTNVALTAGVFANLPGLREGTGSAWGDYDLDGDLDLFIGSYRSAVAGNRLFRNNGDETFTDVTAEAGIEQNRIQGFVPGFVDLNRDGWPDMLLVADTGSSKLFINNGDGTFRDETHLAQGIETANGMGSAVGDLDHDGRLDWYVSGSYYPEIQGPGNVLMMQNPDGSFSNVSEQAGTKNGGWGWGVLIVDLDNDGLDDLVETNGFTTQWVNEQSYLYKNMGDGTFHECALSSGFVHFGQGRGLINADFDNDGDQDLAIFSTGEHMTYYRNDLIGFDRAIPDHANFLRIQLDTSARDSLPPRGTGAFVTTTIGDQTRLNVFDGGFNHCSSGEHDVHLGLGTTTLIDAVRIEWTDGTFTTLVDVPANQILTVRAPAHPADSDGDDLVTNTDVFAFLDRFMAHSLVADHNGTGDLDFFDVLGFLADFAAAQAEP